MVASGTPHSCPSPCLHPRRRRWPVVANGGRGGEQRRGVAGDGQREPLAGLHPTVGFIRNSVPRSGPPQPATSNHIPASATTTVSRESRSRHRPAGHITTHSMQMSSREEFPADRLHRTPRTAIRDADVPLSGMWPSPAPENCPCRQSISWEAYRSARQDTRRAT
jgi:hypothetical protein